MWSSLCFFHEFLACGASRNIKVDFCLLVVAYVNPIILSCIQVGHS